MGGRMAAPFLSDPLGLTRTDPGADGVSAISSRKPPPQSSTGKRFPHGDEVPLRVLNMGRDGRPIGIRVAKTRGWCFEQLLSTLCGQLLELCQIPLHTLPSTQPILLRACCYSQRN